ncbi:hypothetical protein [Virgibacillus necropolis]|uniref:Uncharacterized protein n=1 Tax=Virgibacillus necropolis TaxID=163877 RepID=A0A221MFK6_9BACI|nr:hypothetical protein [Virgibacillus necropolis]ASN06359.1 hypothetical protein CFK40_15690 [Virgibacillus necropolis]
MLNPQKWLTAVLLHLQLAILLAEISSIHDSEQIELIKSQYKLGMAQIGLATTQQYLGIEKEADIDISKEVYTITKIISPIPLP